MYVRQRRDSLAGIANVTLLAQDFPPGTEQVDAGGKELTVHYPSPTDDPTDPLNWSQRTKVREELVPSLRWAPMRLLTLATHPLSLFIYIGHHLWHRHSLHFRLHGSHLGVFRDLSRHHDRVQHECRSNQRECASKFLFWS